MKGREVGGRKIRPKMKLLRGKNIKSSFGANLAESGRMGRKTGFASQPTGKGLENLENTKNKIMEGPCTRRDINPYLQKGDRAGKKGGIRTLNFWGGRDMDSRFKTGQGKWGVRPTNPF